MKRISLFLAVFCVAMTAIQAQVLSVSPVFPKETDTVTIVYNAKLGNGALVGASQVYAHTGVITTASTSGSDWKHVVGTWGTADNRTKMTYMGNDLRLRRQRSHFANGLRFSQYRWQQSRS
ncbi:MAG: hypothetical protein RI977_1113 [Bacteroidota bacterium]